MQHTLVTSSVSSLSKLFFKILSLIQLFDELVLSLLLVIECVGEDAADEFKVFCEHAEYDCCDSFGEIDEVEDVEEEDEDICEGDCDIC